MLSILKDFKKNKSSNTKISIFHVSCSGIVNGVFLPKYGSASNLKIGAMPLISIPLRWRDYPKNTKTFAITIIDYDTVPIIGFPWIHWLVANIPATINYLPENSSIDFASSLCQGRNSFSNGYSIHLKELSPFMVPQGKANVYGGFVPVNFPHKYTVTVFALDKYLPLTEGFTYNQLYYSMNDSILGIATLTGIYNAKINML